MSKPTNNTHLEDVGLIDLPGDWDIVEIQDLLSSDRGISVGVMYPGDHDPNGIPIVKVGDLTSNIINPLPDFCISSEKHHEYRRTEFEGGELLVTLVGALGHCAVVPESMKGWNAARAIAVLRFKNPEDAHFVRVCLLSPPLNRLINVWANTSVQATINLKEIKKLPIPFPKSNERQKIVQFISCLDRKIENLRKQNETLERIAQTLFKHWFVDFEFPNDEGKPYKSSGGEMVRSELGEIPMGWQVRRFDSLGELNRGKSKHRPRHAEHLYGGKYPFIQTGDIKSSQGFITEYEQRYSESGLAQSKLWENETLCITIAANIGETGILTFSSCFPDSVIGFVADSSICDVYYIHRMFKIKRQEIENEAIGSVQKNLNLETIAKIKFVISDSMNYEKLMIFSRFFGKRITSNKKQIKTLSKTRDVLLPKLMSGQIRVKG
jgi:type I restriction enzyme, S subunit